MFNQRISRTLDRTRDTARAQQPPHQRRLATAKVTREGDDHPASHKRREPRPEPFGGGAIGEAGGQR